MLRVLVVLSSLGCVQEMKTTIEVVSNNRFPTPLPPSGDVIEGLLKDLDQNGIVLLPRLIPDEQLQSIDVALPLDNRGAVADGECLDGVRPLQELQAPLP